MGILLRGYEHEKIPGCGTGNGDGERERGQGTGIGNWDGDQEWVITGKEMRAAVIGDG